MKEAGPEPLVFTTCPEVDVSCGRLARAVIILGMLGKGIYSLLHFIFRVIFLVLRGVALTLARVGAISLGGLMMLLRWPSTTSRVRDNGVTCSPVCTVENDVMNVFGDKATLDKV